MFRDRPATVFALSSAPGRAAVAVIRVSGPSARPALSLLVSDVPEPRVVALRRIVDPVTGDPLDEALVVWFKAPRSETGEDIVELQVHGGRAVVSAVLDVLGRIDGLRPAGPGEFARRAFANGKLDLTRAEGLADLIDAETEAQRRQALRQASGALHKLYDGWRGRLIDAQALVEAAIDFSDEADVATDAFRKGAAIADGLAQEIDVHLASGYRGEILRDGFRVVIAGPPNAGKSSLINALARRDVAIVSPEAGTTRDVIEARLDLGGVPVLIADTAGLREAVDVGAVESEGMRRTRDRAGQANLLVWLVDATAPVWQPPADLTVQGISLLVVVNKVDLFRTEDRGDQRTTPIPDAIISAKTGEGVDDLVHQLGELAKAAVPDGDSVIPTSARQREHLGGALAALHHFRVGEVAEPELRAEDLRLAASELGRITGRVDPEDVLDRVFARFCIGK